MAENPKYSAPYEDPFDDQVSSDPFIDDHFGSQAGSGRSGTEALPDATAILVLGILSILGAFCYGIIGLILGIISIAMASRPERLYRDNPGRYTPSSYSNMQAGKVCGIIGLSLSALVVLLIALAVVVSVNRW